LAIVTPIVAQPQATLDAAVFEEELEQWVKAHWPSTPASTYSSTEYASKYLIASLNVPLIARELRQCAPITICGAKLPDGKTCQRKVVGESGRLCYEHRATTDGPAPR
jgi:hypothetical protein